MIYLSSNAMSASKHGATARRGKMSDLKNPFGLRDSNIVMIEDISLDERGLKCNCVCPACKEPFEARLGEVRAHHFAHSGEGCDEEIAYLNGLYKLVQEYVLAHPVILPALNVYWSNSITRFEERDFFCRIRYTNNKSGNLNRSVAMVAKSVQFETAEIDFTGKRPSALLLSCQSRQLALRIKPPATACKSYTVEPYGKTATIELDTSEISFGELKKEQIQSMLGDQLSRCRWLYNPKAISALDNINKSNDEWIESNRKQRELLEQQRDRIWATQSKSIIYPSKMQERRESEPSSQNDEETLGKRRIEIKNRFTQQETEIFAYGQRWIQCTECGIINPADYFTDYGGRNRVNSGICKDCSRKIREQAATERK